jgi:hypothetical protein
MGNIPLPALQINSYPGPGPLQQLATLQDILSQRQGMQMRGEQIQGAGQENQMRQLQLEERQTLMDTSKGIDWTQPDAFQKFISNAQQSGKVSPQTLSQMSMQRQQYLEQLQKTDKGALDLDQDRNNKLLGHIDAIKGITDPAKRQAAAQTQGTQILNAGLVKDPNALQKIQAMASGQYVPTDDELSIEENGLLDHKTQVDLAVKQQEAAAKTSEASTAATKAATEAAEFKEKMPGGALNRVTQDIQIATNPQIQAGKVQVAAAEGAARANVEAQMARGSNAALANVPPHLINQATEAATKAGTDYAQAQSVTQRLNAMMDAARRGNVVSYQLIPEEGALQVVTSQGVHRINFTEIANYGGGSLWQKLVGHLGKAISGRSIPDSVLNDMGEMQDIMAKGAQSKYENSLKTINQNYGSNFKPVKMDMTQSARPPGATMKVPGSDGKIHWSDGKQDLGVAE